MVERILDLSALSEVDYNKVVKGYQDFLASKKLAYFGFVDKKTFKKMGPEFDCAVYGPIMQVVAASAIMWTGYSVYKMYRKVKEKQEKEVVEENTEE